MKEDVAGVEDLFREEETELKETMVTLTGEILETNSMRDPSGIITGKTHGAEEVETREIMIKALQMKKDLIAKIMATVRMLIKEIGFLTEGINSKNIIKKKDKKIAMSNWIDIPKIVSMKKKIINLKTIIKIKIPI